MHGIYNFKLSFHGSPDQHAVTTSVITNDWQILCYYIAVASTSDGAINVAKLFIE
jgi:hypothetical protein